MKSQEKMTMGLTIYSPNDRKSVTYNYI